MKAVISPKGSMLPQEWRDLRRGFLKYFLLPLLGAYLTIALAKLKLGYSFSDSIIPDEFFFNSLATLMFPQIISFTSKYTKQNMVLVPDTDTEMGLPVDTPTVIDTGLLPKNGA